MPASGYLYSQSKEIRSSSEVAVQLLLEGPFDSASFHAFTEEET